MPTDTAEVGIQEVQAEQDRVCVSCPDAGVVQQPRSVIEYKFLALLAFVLSIEAVGFCSFMAAFAYYERQWLVMTQSFVGLVICSLVSLYLYLRR